MKPRCPTCNGSTLIIVEKFNVLSTIGFSQVAVPCPECRPHLQPKPVYDGKMAAAGDTQ